MGIRFACPNGHPLHVKAELAGKRGICPECQVRFLIPTPPGSKPAASEAKATAADHPNGAKTESSAPPLAAVPEPSTASPEPAPEVAQPPQPVMRAAGATPQAAEPPQWYVRPSAGGQFGPADDQLVQQWAAEGRVGPDALVWRTGWPDWQQASDVPEYFPQLAQQAAHSPLSAHAEYNSATGVPGGTPTSGPDVSLATARYQRRKQRSARGQMLAAVLLVVLAIALAGVLFWVIKRTTSSAETTAPQAPETSLGDSTDQEPSEPTSNDDSVEPTN